MTAALILTAAGLLTPFMARQLTERVPTLLVIAAHLSALLLAWVGLVDLVVGVAGLAHRLAEFCELALRDPPGTVEAAVVMIVVVGALAGRAARTWWRTTRAIHRTRRWLDGAADHEIRDASVTLVGSVACTIGVVRPRIFVDRDLFPRLTTAEQRAVLEHERAHVTGRHGFVDLTARCLAAGLAPWPGAAVAYGEIRRHLEALADDRAASRTSRRTVAEAIVTAATMPPQSTLGTGGWTAWRLDRQLDPPRSRRLMAGLAAVPLVVAGVVLAQTVGHAVAGIHLLPVAFPAI